MKKEKNYLFSIMITFMLLITPINLKIFESSPSIDEIINEDNPIEPVGDLPVSPEPYIWHNITVPEGKKIMGGFGDDPSNYSIYAVNWSFYWSYLENLSSWKLEYTDKIGDPWEDYTEYLIFDRIVDELNYSEKQIINFTVPDTGYYRANFTANASVSSYEFDELNHSYSLNLSIPNSDEFYYLVYNWSDIVHSSWNPFIVYSHGLDDDGFFYFEVFINKKVTKNDFISIDPIFGWNGNQTTGGHIGNRMLGPKGTTGSYGGSVDSFHIYLTDSGNKDLVKVMLYEGDEEKTYIGQSEEYETTPNEDNWVQLSPESSYSVTGSTQYFILGYSDSTNTDIGYETHDEETYHGGYYNRIPDGMSYPEYEENFVDWSYHDTTYSISAYVTYTPVIPNDPPVQESENPANTSTSICPTPTLHVYCDDPDGDTMNATWHSNSSGGWVQFGVANKSISDPLTIYQNNSNFSEWGKTYWWRVDVSDGEGNWCNETYHFTNYNLLVPEMGNIIPVNGSSGVSTSPTCSIKTWDNSTCDDDVNVYWYDNASSGYHVYLCDDVDGQAFEGDTASRGLFNDNDGEFTSMEYQKIAVDNGEYADYNSAPDIYQYFLFNFTIDEPENTINYLNLTFRGMACEISGPWGISFWVHNFSSGSWVEFDSHTTAGKDNLFANFTVNCSDFISDWGFLECGVYSDNTGAPGSIMNVYYVEVNVTGSSVWGLKQTNSSVVNGVSLEYVFSGAMGSSTKYWWMVVVNNSQQTNSSWYTFTTQAGPTPEVEITIDYAGNLGDSGGPYWLPPDETTQLTTAGYYANHSYQHEDWILIKCTITNATTVYLDWKNGSIWANGTYTLTNTGGDNWEINTSGTIQTMAGFDYSFNINATGTSDSNITWWNKTGIGGEYFRRTVQLNCTGINIDYTPFYIYRGKMANPDINKQDRFEKDQSTDGSTTDTGLLNSSLPGDTIENINCLSIVAGFINNNSCFNSDTIDNIYYHIWWSGYYNTMDTIGWTNTSGLWGSESASDVVNFSKTTARSNIDYDTGGRTDFWLATNFSDITSWSFTDNNIYEFMPLLMTDSKSGAGPTLAPTVLNNRSFTSFVILNVPSDIMDGTDNLTDTDNDGLSDHMEINETYGLHTNPFIADTDNDGVNDIGEKVSGSDPNNFTDTVAPSDPTIIIDFAGNLGDSGGPYYRPPGETTQLTGAYSDGYYANSSKQSEDWIYIKCTITDATSVYLDWKNGSIWTNGTYSLVNTDGNNWEINTSGNITTCEGFDYSFNINASNPALREIYWWNKTGISGNDFRRTVQLNCTPVDITFTPFYFYKANQTSSELTYKKDRLQHDQGNDATLTDTGYLKDDIPTGYVESIYCSSFTGLWFGDSISVQDFTLTDIYYHIWYSNDNDTQNDVFLWRKTRDIVQPTGASALKTFGNNPTRSEIYYDSPSVNDNFSLYTGTLDPSDTGFTDNDIYEFLFFLKETSENPIVVSNRSFNSWVMFNVPSNETLNATGDGDTDDDGLSDWYELFVSYTNPFLTDTDFDTVNDASEISGGSDPNNYTDTFLLPAIDAEINVTYWDIGNIALNTFAMKNFTFYQNGSSTLDITIAVNDTNYTFVTYADWLSLGHDRFCANSTNDTWSTEDNIAVGYPGTTVLYNDFAPGNFQFGVRIWLPRTTGQPNTREDFEIALTVSEAT